MLDAELIYNDEIFLFNSLKEKNRTAFSVLYDKYAGSLLGIINRSVKGQREAEEVLSKSFIEIWNCIDDYKGNHTSLFQWMLGKVMDQTRCFMLINEINRDSKIQSVSFPVSIEDSLCEIKSEINLNGESVLDKYRELIVELIYFNGNKVEDLAVYFNITVGKLKDTLRNSIRGIINKEEI